METIGQRAAMAIRNRAKEKRTLLETELANVDVSRKVLCDWENYNRNPQAYFLQQMALAGYDIYWILTGEKMNDTKNVCHHCGTSIFQFCEQRLGCDDCPLAVEDDWLITGGLFDGKEWTFGEAENCQPNIF